MADFVVSFHADVENHAVSFDDTEDYEVSYAKTYDISDGGYEKGYDDGYEKGYDDGLSEAGAEWYEGEYNITPKTTAQMLETADKLMKGNIVINPIPKNYGLITYNGFGITVS